MCAPPITERRPRAVMALSVFVSIAAFVLDASTSRVAAARVEDLYAAEVPPPEQPTSGLQGAFEEALARVLVKVTGRRDVTQNAVLWDQLGNAAALVQQYRTDADGNVWVRFDHTAIKRALDNAGQPFWPEDRPTTLVWLAMDAGGGDREILSAGEGPGGAAAGPLDPTPANWVERENIIRDALYSAASERGLPLMLPLVDSEDLTVVSFADLWGDFTAPVAQASARYGPDITLIGRARIFSPDEIRVRWTLLLANERYDWQGAVADGPEDLADLLAGQMATSIHAAQELRVRVAGVNSVDDYGRVSTYLSGLGIVDSCGVEQVSGDDIVFALNVRGNADQLMRSIALRRLLQPIDEPVGQPLLPAGTVAPDLQFQLIAGP